MTSEISFRVLSDNEIFSNHFVKFWKDSAKFWKDSARFWKDSAKFWKDSAKFFFEQADDWDEISTCINISFSFFFLKKCLVEFFEIFFNNLKNTRINSLHDFLFRDDAFEVVDWVNCEVANVLKTSFADEDLNCS